MLTLVRHAKSTVNGSKASAIARGNPMAELSPEGLKQIPALRAKILDRIGDRGLETIPVNVTELWRTRQTAQEVGFKVLNCLPLMNESSEAAPLEQLLERMKKGWLPADTLQRAEEFMGNPDLQAEYNVSHGLFIASCRYVGGERPHDGNTRRLVPYYAEIVDVPT